MSTPTYLSFPSFRFSPAKLNATRTYLEKRGGGEGGVMTYRKRFHCLYTTARHHHHSYYYLCSPRNTAIDNDQQTTARRCLCCVSERPHTPKHTTKLSTTRQRPTSKPSFRVSSAVMRLVTGHHLLPYYLLCLLPGQHYYCCLLTPPPPPTLSRTRRTRRRDQQQAIGHRQHCSVCRGERGQCSNG